MGLFDNIIGTATEGVEPLSMDTIVDESAPKPAGGGGSSGSGDGGGSGSGSSGSGGIKKEENPNVVSGDQTSSILITNTSPEPASGEIPNIDIGGGDMFNFSFTPPATETPTNNEVPPAITPTDSLPQAPISTATEVPQPEIVINSTIEIKEEAPIADTTPTSPNIEIVTPPESAILPTADDAVTLMPVVETPAPTIEILDTSAPVVESTEPVINTSGSLIDMGVSTTPTIITETVAPETETTGESPITIQEETVVAEETNLEQKEEAIISSSSEAVVPKTLEALNERISSFIDELQELKEEEKKLIEEKDAALAKIEEEKKIAVAKIEETVALLNNHTII